VPEPRGDVPVNVLVRPGRDAGAVILATVRADPPDLLLLGWRGSPGRGRYLLGSTLDPVIRYAPCDVAVARANDGPRSAALPGVAVAAALTSPLTTVGLGLALGNSRIAGGALVLFLANLVAISAAGGLVFLWLGFRPTPGRQKHKRVFRSGVLGMVALLVAVSAVLGVFLQSADDQQVHLVRTFFEQLDFRRFQVDLREPIAMDDPSKIPELTAYEDELGRKILNDETDRALEITAGWYSDFNCAIILRTDQASDLGMFHFNWGKMLPSRRVAL